jgi:hypothetical protein
MHVLLLIVWFVVLNIDDYFGLVVFHMAQPTLYVAWHAVFSTCDYDVHM